MSDPVFDRALSRVLVIEKLYANDPNDTGGETVWGIARKHWPKWEGWALVDAWRKKPNFPENMRSDPKLTAAMRAFYRAEFWISNRCDELPALVADKIFEIGVNTGTRPGAELLQVALTSLGHPVRIDGAIGPATVAAARALEPAAVKSAIQAAQAGYYLGIVKCVPSKRGFRNGWLVRAFT